MELYGEPPTNGTFTPFLDLKSTEESTYKVHKRPDKKSPLSVYYCNYRSIYEDNYPAKFDEELARFLIRQYSNEGEIVLDPMAGAGTIPLVALELGRNAIYQDINQDAIDLFQEKRTKVTNKKCWSSYTHSDATKFIPTTEMVDLILTSPPFGMSIDAAHDKYSDNPDDIGNSKTYEIWRSKMKQVLKNCFDVLKPGKLCILETKPRSKKGHSYPLNMWLAMDGIDIGFDFFCEYIKVVDTYRMWTFGQEDQRMPIPAHSYLTILRKPENEKLF